MSFCLQGKAAQLVAGGEVLLVESASRHTAWKGFPLLWACSQRDYEELPSVRSPGFHPLPPLEAITPLVSHRLEEVSAMDCGDLSLPIPSVVGRVEHMELQFGQETVLCSALVVDDEMLEFCIGLQTLWSLKVRNSSLLIARLLSGSSPRSGCCKHQKYLMSTSLRAMTPDRMLYALRH